MEAHPYLEDSLCSNKRIEPLYIDSQITSHVINKFTAPNKSILTIHDSHIISNREAELLRDAMRHATPKIVGADLAVDQEGIS